MKPPKPGIVRRAARVWRGAALAAVAALALGGFWRAALFLVIGWSVAEVIAALAARSPARPLRATWMPMLVGLSAIGWLTLSSPAVRGEGAMQEIRYIVAGEVRARMPRVPTFTSDEEWVAAFKAAQGSEPKLACWLYGDGQIEVETPRAPGETEQEWCDRHDDAVDAALEEFPSAGECSG